MTPLLLGLLTVIAPLLLGALLGRSIPRLVDERRRRWLVPVLAAQVALAPLVIGPRVPVSIYDLLLMALCFAAAFHAAGRAGERTPIPRAGVALAAGILAVGFASAELVARRIGPAQRAPHSVGELRFVFETAASDFACDALARVAPAIDRKGRSGPVTLHLGDSMVASYDVAPEERFTTLIQAARPDQTHQAFGFPGVGPDTYCALVLRQVPVLRPDHVVVFLFLGNDFFDMDKPHGCCGNERILDYPGGAAQLRCTSLGAAMSLGQKLRIGPAPFLLRVLASSSTAAHTLTSGFERAPAPAKPWVYTDWAPTPPQLEHGLAAILAIRDELGRQKIGMKLVLLPPRWTLERRDPGDPFHAVRERVVRDTRAAGIRVFDSWDLFQAALDRDAASDWFQREGGNPHFGVAGHRLLARWLIDEVLER